MARTPVETLHSGTEILSAVMKPHGFVFELLTRAWDLAGTSRGASLASVELTLDGSATGYLEVHSAELFRILSGARAPQPTSLARVPFPPVRLVPDN